LDLRFDWRKSKVASWIRRIETAELVAYYRKRREPGRGSCLRRLGGTSPTLPGRISAEVVVGNTFEELKAPGREKVAGKIVLFHVPFDKQKSGDIRVW
jgi:hypothetical protein